MTGKLILDHDYRILSYTTIKKVIHLFFEIRSNLTRKYEVCLFLKISLACLYDTTYNEIIAMF